MRGVVRTKLAKLGGALAIAGVLGCGGPTLDVSPQAPSWTLELAPAATPSAAPSVLRGRLRGAPASGEPWLVTGELSSYSARALKRGEVTSALRERALPLRYWQEGDDCWFQPLVPLQPDESYTLAVAGFGTVQSLRVAAQAAPPLGRLFPAAGRPKHHVAVVCDLPTEIPLAELVLQPNRIPLQVDGEWLADVAPGCSVLAAQAAFESLQVGPPEVGTQLLEPSPWLPAGPVAASPSCPRGRVVAGACLELDDDRVTVTPGSEDELWLLREPRPVRLVANAASRSSLLRELQPEQSLFLRGSVLSSGGQREDFALPLQLAAPRRHVVINEVLSNPRAAEASGEWIEIVNDSARSAKLAGLWLEDASGHVALPAEELGPGELALLVPPGFRASAPDVLVPDSVRLLELPRLGDRGLANAGEALLLSGAEGVVSRFPGFDAVHAGVSWARRAYDAADDDPGSFAEHGRPGASPGAPNCFDPAE